MKLLDTKYLESDVVELKFSDDIDSALNWEVGGTVELLEDNGLFYIRQDGCFAEIECSHLSLAKAVSYDDPQVVCCVICYKNNAAVAVRFMYLQAQCQESIQLVFDQASIESIAKVSGVDANFKETEKWFEEQFYFSYQQQKAILCEFDSSTNGDTFSIVGEKYFAKMIKIRDAWYINTVTKLNRSVERLTVFYGQHKLVHETSESLAKNDSYQILLDQHTKAHGSYFQLWQKYSETHWLQSSRIAKSASYLAYSECIPISDEKIKFRFILGDNRIKQFLDSYKSELENLGERFSLKNLELEVSKDIPDYLTGINAQPEYKDKQSKRPNFISDIIFENGCLEATLKMKPPKKGFIFISLNGMKVQHQRKMQAFDLLRSGNNHLPQIKHILEGMKPPEQRPKKIRALSAKARKCFGKGPTRQQEKALKIALNTPDIALIIGPPGTGKTKVITALQQRIAEEGDAFGSSIEHQILLSSYQHDATDNVTSKGGVFGLPAVNVSRRDKSEQSGSATAINSWLAERIEKLTPEIENELLSFDAYRLYESINDVILSVRLSRSPVEIKRFLLLLNEKLDSWQIDFGFNIKSTVSDPIQCLMQRFDTWSGINISANERDKLYRLVRGIRTTDIAYNDDGLQRADTLSQHLTQSPDMLEYAKQLQYLIENGHPAQDYIDLKKNLQDILIEPYMLPNVRYINDVEISYLEDLQDNLEEILISNPILGQLHFRKKYLRMLKHQPDMVAQSVTEYVTVLGATCQQSAGNKMVSVKAVPQSSSITFDSVIIDEAARANPLDLMIPMAMARTRIVLVGDHKQLPHMLEPRVEKELQDKNEIEITEQELLKQSLFERLYYDLIKFEEEGGPKRVVMLDTQFRMHPILGEFHSKEFYESAGLPAVKSGLEASEFPLDVPGYKGELAAWIHVGQDQGKMKTVAGSKYRQCEADIIVEQAASILGARKDLSVGIITFYGAQRDLIQEILVEKGLMNKSFGEYKPAEGFDLLPNGDERFRVGSVDAFQGKEFDVVLLSTVRHWRTPKSLTEDGINRQLGFLRIINRINVAMSRQKRLLIVVGDDSLASPDLTQKVCFDGENAEDKIILPGFPAFYHQLCKKEYGSVR